jgi:hypothetical protein
MGEKLMLLEGNNSENSHLNLVGSYAYPPGPDWSWRIVISPCSDQSLQIVMLNITPTGEEQPAVEARLYREQAN